MLIFIVFMFVTFAVGLYFWNKRTGIRHLSLLILCVFMAFAYLYLNQI